jgi:hypothetical protein
MHSPDSRSQATIARCFPPCVSLARSRAGPNGTMKDTVLESVPLRVTTLIAPVVAPAGTVVVISELATTVNLAAVPLKVTPVAPFRSVPRILTAAPTAPEAVSLQKRPDLLTGCKALLV